MFSISIFILLLMGILQSVTSIVTIDGEEVSCPVGTLYDGKICISLRDHCKKTYKIMDPTNLGSCQECPEGEGPNIDGNECIKDIQIDEDNGIQIRNGIMNKIMKFPPSKNGIISDLYMDPVEHMIIEPQQCDHCHHDFVYFALFGEDGTVLEEVGGHSIKATRNRKLKKPDQNDAKVKAGMNPSYLFALTNDENEDCQRIFAGLSTSGAKMVVVQEDQTIRLIADESTPIQKFNEINNIPDDLSMIRERSQDEEERKLRESTMNACWNIYKWEHKFYVIESKKFPGNFWRSSSNGLNLVPQSNAELFTGINTNFMLSMVLDVEDFGPDVTNDIADVERGYYGDIVASYYLPNGTKSEGYICDYQWDEHDADVFCQSQDKFQNLFGFPTYRGHFTPAKPNINFAMSMVDCKRSETFEDCRIHSECTEGGLYLCQHSLNMYNGRAFGCKQKGADASIAGVICADYGTVEELKAKSAEYKCKRGHSASDKRSIQRMFSLESQGSKNSEIMTQNKHWSEYLTPVPMTVSLLSMLLLVSAQFQRQVWLVKPTSGEFEHLKWDTLRPNLETLKNHMIDGFQTSSRSMMRIYSNSKEMNSELERTVKYSFLPDHTNKKYIDKSKLLKKSISSLNDLANENIEKCNDAVNKFDETSKFIGELVESVSGTQVLNSEEKDRLEKIRDRTKDKKERKEKESVEVNKKLEALQKEEKLSLKKLFTEAKREKEKSCLMDGEDKSFVKGIRPCNKCVSKETRIRKNLDGKDACLQWGKRDVNCQRICKQQEQKCSEYENVCVDTETRCVKNEKKCERKQNGKCKEYRNGKCLEWKYNWAKVGHDCISWERLCNEHERECVSYIDDCKEKKEYCKTFELQCKGQAEYCGTWETTCDKEDYCQKYDWIPERMECSDIGSKDIPCSSCADAERVEETIKSAMRTSTQIAMKSLGDEKKTQALVMIMNNLEDNLIHIKGKIEIKFDKQAEQETTSTSTTTLPAPTISSEKPSEDCEDADCNDLLNESVKKAEVDTKLEPGLDVATDLAVLKRTLPVHKRQLKLLSIKNPLAHNILLTLESLKSKVNLWTQGGRYKNLVQDDINELKVILDNLDQAKVQVEREASDEVLHPDLENKGVTIGTKVGQFAMGYVKTQIERQKTAEKAELLSVVIEQAIDEMASQTIKIDDYRSAMEFLKKCAAHLNKLKQTWGNLGDFFVKIRELLNMVQLNTRRVREQRDLYEDITIDDVRQMIMDTIRKSSINAYSQNLYVIQVAKFYNELMDIGLLRKIRGLRFEHCTSENCVNNIKSFINKDCKASTKKIKEKISIDQANMNKQMTRRLESMRNFVACAIEDSPKNLEGRSKEDAETLKNLSHGLRDLEQIGKGDSVTESLSSAEEAAAVYGDPELNKDIGRVTRKVFSDDEDEDLLDIWA